MSLTRYSANQGIRDASIAVSVSNVDSHSDATAVEDAVSPVLRTFRSKVDTTGFAKLSAITEQHATTMRRHYGEISSLLHKMSDEMNPDTPDTDRIEDELDAVDAWLTDIKKRQKRIRSF